MIAAVTDIRDFRTKSTQSLYADFSPHELEGYSFRRHELFPQDEHQVWSIEEGFVRTVNFSEDGEVVTLGLWGGGDVVGQPFSASVGYEVECLTPVKARLVRLNQIDLTEVRSQQLEQMEMFLTILHCRPLPQRLCLILEYFARKYARVSDRGLILDMRLTHQALAEMIGSTRVTVSRLMKKFESEGKLVRLSHQKLLLLNMSGTQP